MGEVGEGVPIGGGDDEPVANDTRTKRRGGWCRRASHRAPVSVAKSHVEDEDEDGEVAPTSK